MSKKKNKNSCYYPSKGYPCKGSEIIINKKTNKDFKPVYHRPRFIKYNDFGEYMENQIKARKILNSNNISYIGNEYSSENMYEIEFRERQIYKSSGGHPINFAEAERLAMMRQKRLNYLNKRRKQKKKTNQFFDRMKVLNVSSDNKTVELWLPDCIPDEESHTFNINDEGEFKGKPIREIVNIALVKTRRL